MGYAWLGLGILGLLTSLVIYLKADPDSFLYEAGLFGYLMSWVALVYGTWSVLR